MRNSLRSSVQALRVVLFIALVMNCHSLSAAAAPTSPVWSDTAGSPALSGAGVLSSRYYVEASVGTKKIKFWYVESAATVNNPFPMGAIYNENGARFQEVNNPSRFHVLDGQTYKGGYAVAFTNNYWMSEDEVSQALWREVMGAKPTDWPNFPEDDGWSNYIWNAASADPVVFVNYAETENFFTALNALPGFSSLAVGAGAGLPTEAEWEFAARTVSAPSAGDPWPAMRDDWQESLVSSTVDGLGNYVFEAFGPRIKRDSKGNDTIEGTKKWLADDMKMKSDNINANLFPIGTTYTLEAWNRKGFDDFNGVWELTENHYQRPAYVYDWRFALHESNARAGRAVKPGDFPPLAQMDKVTITDFEANTKLDKYNYIRVIKTGGYGQWKMFLRYDSINIDANARNDWGLRHMHGNVAEWCQDSWNGTSPYKTQKGLAAHPDEDGKAGGVNDPADGHFANGTGSLKVIRGGSWHDGAHSCRVAARAGADPSTQNDKIGFRIVVKE